MTRTLARLWLPALTAAAVLLGLAADARVAAGDKDKGFTDLFNGKDMTGFKYVITVGNKKTVTKKGDKEIVKNEPIFERGDDPLKASKKTWRVENGVIICTGSPNGYFYTDKSYKNYVVRFDWKFKRPAKLEDDEKFGGNSGYLAHITGEHKVWPKCVEVQGYNKEHGKIFAIGGAKGKYTFDAEALKKARHPVGEWNTTEITFEDGKISSKVNGALIGTGTGELTEGPFGLQSEGAEIHFKNIKIKEVK
jgi:hypothetical protein